MITIVSGLPRSGTSLMMQMLAAGGMPILSDGERQADVDNPRGYLEWERIKQLPKDPACIAEADRGSPGLAGSDAASSGNEQARNRQFRGRRGFREEPARGRRLARQQVLCEDPARFVSRCVARCERHQSETFAV